jgi:RHS repeat-associated protein
MSALSPAINPLPFAGKMGLGSGAAAGDKVTDTLSISRIRKVVEELRKTDNGQPATYVLTSDTRFLYDGWNLVAEYQMSGLNTENFKLKASFFWALDLSQTPQGAGGVGGLMLTTTHTSQISNLSNLKYAAPSYDSNGNVLSLVSLTTNTLTARYEYSAFGETLEMEGGATAEENPFRFSTKYTDGETALVYYGYRYYSPELGRWPSRDPIGERGGHNVVAFVQNQSLGKLDFLGLYDFSPIYNEIEQGGKDSLAEAKRELENRQAEFDKLPREEKVNRDRPSALYEYCGRVCRNNTSEGCKYYRTGPITTGKSGDCDPTLAPPCNSGDVTVGVYHNHPDNKGISGFGPGESGGDKLIADRGKNKSQEYSQRNGFRPLPPENAIPPRTPVGATFEDGNGIHTDIYNPHLHELQRR